VRACQALPVALSFEPDPYHLCHWSNSCYEVIRGTRDHRHVISVPIADAAERDRLNRQWTSCAQAPSAAKLSWCKCFMGSIELVFVAYVGRRAWLSFF